MILFFNLEKLEKLAGANPNKFIKLLEYHYKDIGTKSKYNPSRLSLKGSSFLLNPTPLFNNQIVDIHYIIQYVKLAGRRDYALYLTHKFTALDTSFFPDLDINKIKTNPLLTFNNKLINFKYEELNNGTKIW